MKWIVGLALVVLLVAVATAQIQQQGSIKGSLKGGTPYVGAQKGSVKGQFGQGSVKGQFGQGSVKGQLGQQGAIKGQMGELKGQLGQGSVKGQMGELKGQGSVKGQLGQQGAIKGQMGSVKGQLGQGSVKGQLGQQGAIKGQMGSVKGQVQQGAIKGQIGQAQGQLGQGQLGQGQGQGQLGSAQPHDQFFGGDMSNLNETTHDSGSIIETTEAEKSPSVMDRIREHVIKEKPQEQQQQEQQQQQPQQPQQPEQPQQNVQKTAEETDIPNFTVRVQGTVTVNNRELAPLTGTISRLYIEASGDNPARALYHGNLVIEKSDAKKAKERRVKFFAGGEGDKAALFVNLISEDDEPGVCFFQPAKVTNPELKMIKSADCQGNLYERDLELETQKEEETIPLTERYCFDESNELLWIELVAEAEHMKFRARFNVVGTEEAPTADNLEMFELPEPCIEKKQSKETFMSELEDLTSDVQETVGRWGGRGFGRWGGRGFGRWGGRGFGRWGGGWWGGRRWWGGPWWGRPWWGRPWWGRPWWWGRYPYYW